MPRPFPGCCCPLLRRPVPTATGSWARPTSNGSQPPAASLPRPLNAPRPRPVRRQRCRTPPTTTSGRKAVREMTLAENLPQADASSLVDRAVLETKVRDMYRQVAREHEAALHFAVGRQLALRVGYPYALLDAIPAEALASFAGVGYHLDLAVLAPGDRVLDLGSGSGTDAFCAALQVGPSGRVVGIDFTDEQIDKATRLRDRGGFAH